MFQRMMLVYDVLKLQSALCKRTTVSPSQSACSVRCATDSLAALWCMQAPETPAPGHDSISAPEAAITEDMEAAAGHSAKKLAVLKPSPTAAAAAVGNQPQPAVTTAAAAAAGAATTPSMQCIIPSEALQLAEAAAAAAAAAMLAHKAGTARPGSSSRGAAVELQGKAAKARLQRAKARLERRAAVREPEVDMFKGSCAIC